MKWSVIGLVTVGLVAATCVAILVALLPGRGNGQTQLKEVQLIEAVGSLERGTVVTRDHVAVRKVPRGHEPDNAFRDQGQVIGKRLIRSMSKGQIFTKAYFPTEGTGLELASQLPSGMRAVSLAISDSSGLRGLLYPGSTVDILVSLRSSNNDESVSKTLLEEVQVLAIGSKTASSPEEEDGKQPKVERAKKMIVTIAVYPEQAQKLQLAMKHGTLSLALRNPGDIAPSEHKPTHLGTLLGKKSTGPRSIMIRKIPTNPDKNKGIVSPKGPRWSVTVIHGEKAEEVEFQLPK